MVVKQNNTFSFPNATHQIILLDVLRVPNLALNLFSVSQLTNFGLIISFTSTSYFVHDRHAGQRIGTNRRVAGLYHLKHLHLPAVITGLSSLAFTPSVSAFAVSGDRWHRRLCHISGDRLKLFSSSGSLGQVLSSPLSECMGCKLAKHLSLPYSISTFAPALFDLVHSNVWVLHHSLLWVTSLIILVS